MTNRCALIALTSFLVSSGAFAADMPVKAINPPPVLASPSWTGFYVGAGVGMRSTDTTATVAGLLNGGVGGTSLADLCSAVASVGGCVTNEPLNDTAFRFSPYVGYNWQFAPQWLVGVEGDIGIANKTTTLNSMFYPVTGPFGIEPTNDNKFSAKTTWDASVRGRIGYLVTPTTLVYATGGPAWLHVESTSNCSTNRLLGLCDPTFAFTFGTPSITNSTTKLGWTIGGGVETALWSNWVARAEYRYADFGTITNTDVRSGALNPLAVTYDLAIRTHTATLGLAYKFGNSIAAAGEPAVTAMPVKAPVIVSTTSWSGFYLGAGVGIRSTVTDAQVTNASDAGNSLASMCNSLASGGGCTTSQPINDTAFRFSPYAGFNWQFAPLWVAGIEADVGFADKTATLNGMFAPFNSTGISGVAGDTFSVKTTWDASARARIGFLPTPWLMAYATGGPAWLHVEATSTCNTLEVGAGRCEPGAFAPSVITNATTKLGWAIGAGLEAALGSNWVARAEYRYSDFGTITNTDVRSNGGLAPPAPLPLVVTYDLALRTHTATFGVAYKFN
jgi:outer membrane immunogenic protein